MLLKTRTGEKRKYENRLQRLEMASFTPLIFACTSGASKLTTTCLKKLSFLLSEKEHFIQCSNCLDKVQSSDCKAVGLAEKPCNQPLAYFLCAQGIGFTNMNELLFSC